MYNFPDLLQYYIPEGGHTNLLQYYMGEGVFRDPQIVLLIYMNSP